MKKSLVLAVLALAILLVVGVGSAFASDTATVTAGTFVAKTATDTVTVSATINAKLLLVVTTPDAAQSVNFGAVDPGTTANKNVTVQVLSNKGYTVSETLNGAAPIGLTVSNSAVGSYTKAADDTGKSWTQNYKIQVPWNTDPGSYTATMLYTVVQS